MGRPESKESGAHEVSGDQDGRKGGPGLGWYAALCSLEERVQRLEGPGPKPPTIVYHRHLIAAYYGGGIGGYQRVDPTTDVCPDCAISRAD